MNVSLSILIPSYNEARTIGHVIERVAEQQPLVRQIIVVNDGSSDGTRQALDDLKKTWTNSTIELRVIHFENNRGKGAAVRAAIEAATQDYVLIQDANLELNPADYSVLVQPLLDKRAEIVFGDRFPNGFPRNLRLASRVANTIVTGLSNALFALQLRDQACGYKLLPAPLAKDLKLRSEGFEICSEMTAKLGRRHLRIANAPVRYQPRDTTQGKKIRWIDGFIAVYTIVRYRL